MIAVQRRCASFVVRDDLRLGNRVGAKTYPVTNPATDELLTEALDMDRGQAAAAIDAAHAALDGWSSTPAKERAAVLTKWHHAVAAETEYLAQLMTAEQGKPLIEAVGEVGYGNSFLSWFSEEAKRIDGDLIPAATPNQRIMVMHQPVGVCSLVTPWNFPIAMITRKAGAALAAGCTAVIKPAEDTPLSAEAIVALGLKAGIPDGVLSVVTCSRASVPAVGKELATNPKVRKVSFTGSTAVGKAITNDASGTVKRVSMELGGNAPFIVFEDADVDAAVAGAMVSKFRNSGQTCVCANRIFVHSAVYDAFLSKFTDAVEALVVGNGAADGTTQGPLINVAAVEKVDGMVAAAVAAGARVVTGGSKAADKGPNFYNPTILVDVTDGMSIAKDEIFGPVAPIMKFDTDDEVVARANATTAGLAGYFYSKDLKRVFKVADKLQYGMIGVNSGVVSTEVAPFGGIKESGVGREGSKYGIAEYLDTKYVLLDLQ